MKQMTLLPALLLLCCCAGVPAPYGPVPSTAQLDWQLMEYNMFCHFGPNTFTGAEWGSGSEPEDIFNPEDLDCRQWARTARDAGMKGIIITAKHHDGFCLWPNPESLHTVAQSRWRDGKGDVLKELSDACDEYGLGFGVYISPWDRNDPAYGTPEYNAKYARTLQSVHDGRYGTIFEHWFDGACGEGPNGKRQKYDWALFHKTVRELQPFAVMFSDVGPDCRWVGNEKGRAALTNWSRLDTAGFTPGAGAPPKDVLQQGNIDGVAWVPAETDVSIRRGWFWKESECPKSAEELMKIWLESVGRNSLLLLNVPPDTRGRIPAEDSTVLMEFRALREKVFGNNLAAGASVRARSAYCSKRRNLVDGNFWTWWAAASDTPEIEICLREKQRVNCISLQEYIALGQRVASFEVQAWTGEDWKTVGSGTTIGYKRILLLESVCTDRIRVRITSSLAHPVLGDIALYYYEMPSARERAEKLLSQLNLDQKAALSLYDSPAIPELGIKQYTWWNEALHGVGRNGSATVFPMPIGMAASFDDTLLKQVFTAVSDEARIKHKLADDAGMHDIYCGLTFWTPNINIFRDPRWGRGMETYGEDPCLTGRLGSAVVRGLQGDPDEPVQKLHACAKHFAVHSGTEKNRHRFNAEISERDLRETYLPAFKDLVDAGVSEVMTAYNRFRGIPCTASSYLVDSILRREWGFDGLVVSDCWAISDFYEPGRHDYSAGPCEAAAAAARNGLNLECGTSYRALAEAVRRGLVEESVVDANVLRLLEARFRLGEMDGVSPWDNLDPSLVEGAEHRALSLKMAEESLVLLQNRGDMLPLSGDVNLALVGPNADYASMQWGNYNPVPKTTVTLHEAMKNEFGDITYFKGCGHTDGLEDVDALLRELEGTDVVVFAGGISPQLEGEEMNVEIPGFSGGDRTDIELPAVQRRLLAALHDAGKKIVLVNFSGSAMGLVPETESCDAILQAWYPGQDGGTAIVNVLTGRVSPSGRLPVTFYRSVADLPDPEDYNMEGHTYRYFKGEPLYPFGFGLGYTTFSYGKPMVRGNSLVVPVKNTGHRDGTEVVQLYVSRPDDTKGPVRTLRDWKRVAIPAGKTVKVSFELSDNTFVWWSEEAQKMLPLFGTYLLQAGPSSAEAQSVEYSYSESFL